MKNKNTNEQKASIVIQNQQNNTVLSKKSLKSHDADTMAELIRELLVNTSTTPHPSNFKEQSHPDAVILATCRAQTLIDSIENPMIAHQYFAKFYHFFLAPLITVSPENKKPSFIAMSQKDVLIRSEELQISPSAEIADKEFIMNHLQDYFSTRPRLQYLYAGTQMTYDLESLPSPLECLGLHLMRRAHIPFENQSIVLNISSKNIASRDLSQEILSFMLFVQSMLLSDRFNKIRIQLDPIFLEDAQKENYELVTKQLIPLCIDLGVHTVVLPNLQPNQILQIRQDVLDYLINFKKIKDPALPSFSNMEQMSLEDNYQHLSEEVIFQPEMNFSSINCFDKFNPIGHAKNFLNDNLLNQLVSLDVPSFTETLEEKMQDMVSITTGAKQNSAIRFSFGLGDILPVPMIAEIESTIENIILPESIHPYKKLFSRLNHQRDMLTEKENLKNLDILSESYLIVINMTYEQYMSNQNQIHSSLSDYYSQQKSIKVSSSVDLPFNRDLQFRAAHSSSWPQINNPLYIAEKEDYVHPRQPITDVFNPQKRISSPLSASFIQKRTQAQQNQKNTIVHMAMDCTQLQTDFQSIITFVGSLYHLAQLKNPILLQETNQTLQKIIALQNEFLQLIQSQNYLSCLDENNKDSSHVATVKSQLRKISDSLSQVNLWSCADSFLQKSDRYRQVLFSAQSINPHESYNPTAISQTCQQLITELNSLPSYFSSSFEKSFAQEISQLLAQFIKDIQSPNCPVTPESLLMDLKNQLTNHGQSIHQIEMGASEYFKLKSVLTDSFTPLTTNLNRLENAISRQQPVFPTDYEKIITAKEKGTRYLYHPTYDPIEQTATNQNGSVSIHLSRFFDTSDFCNNIRNTQAAIDPVTGVIQHQIHPELYTKDRLEIQLSIYSPVKFRIQILDSIPNHAQNIIGTSPMPGVEIVDHTTPDTDAIYVINYAEIYETLLEDVDLDMKKQNQSPSLHAILADFPLIPTIEVSSKGSLNFIKKTIRDAAQSSADPMQLLHQVRNVVLLKNSHSTPFQTLSWKKSQQTNAVLTQNIGAEIVNRVLTRYLGDDSDVHPQLIKKISAKRPAQLQLQNPVNNTQRTNATSTSQVILYAPEYLDLSAFESIEGFGDMIVENLAEIEHQYVIEQVDGELQKIFHSIVKDTVLEWFNDLYLLGIHTIIVSPNLKSLIKKELEKAGIPLIVTCDKIYPIPVDFEKYSDSNLTGQINEVKKIIDQKGSQLRSAYAISELNHTYGVNSLLEQQFSAQNFYNLIQKNRNSLTQWLIPSPSQIEKEYHDHCQYWTDQQFHAQLIDTVMNVIQHHTDLGNYEQIVHTFENAFLRLPFQTTLKDYIKTSFEIRLFNAFNLIHSNVFQQNFKAFDLQQAYVNSMLNGKYGKNMPIDQGWIIQSITQGQSAEFQKEVHDFQHRLLMLDWPQLELSINQQIIQSIQEYQNYILRSENAIKISEFYCTFYTILHGRFTMINDMPHKFQSWMMEKAMLLFAKALNERQTSISASFSIPELLHLIENYSNPTTALYELTTAAGESLLTETRKTSDLSEINADDLEVTIVNNELELGNEQEQEDEDEDENENDNEEDDDDEDEDEDEDENENEFNLEMPELSPRNVKQLILGESRQYAPNYLHNIFGNLAQQGASALKNQTYDSTTNYRYQLPRKFLQAYYDFTPSMITESALFSALRRSSIAFHNIKSLEAIQYIDQTRAYTHENNAYGLISSGYLESYPIGRYFSYRDVFSQGPLEIADLSDFVSKRKLNYFNAAKNLKIGGIDSLYTKEMIESFFQNNLLRSRDSHLVFDHILEKVRYRPKEYLRIMSEYIQNQLTVSAHQANNFNQLVYRRLSQKIPVNSQNSLSAQIFFGVFMMTHLDKKSPMSLEYLTNHTWHKTILEGKEVVLEEFFSRNASSTFNPLIEFQKDFSAFYIAQLLKLELIPSLEMNAYLMQVFLAFTQNFILEKLKRVPSTSAVGRFIDLSQNLHTLSRTEISDRFFASSLRTSASLNIYSNQFTNSLQALYLNPTRTPIRIQNSEYDRKIARYFFSIQKIDGSLNKHSFYHFMQDLDKTRVKSESSLPAWILYYAYQHYNTNDIDINDPDYISKKNQILEMHSEYWARYSNINMITKNGRNIPLLKAPAVLQECLAKYFDPNDFDAILCDQYEKTMTSLVKYPSLIKGLLEIGVDFYSCSKNVPLFKKYLKDLKNLFDFCGDHRQDRTQKKLERKKIMYLNMMITILKEYHDHAPETPFQLYADFLKKILVVFTCLDEYQSDQERLLKQSSSIGAVFAKELNLSIDTLSLAPPQLVKRDKNSLQSFTSLMITMIHQIAENKKHQSHTDQAKIEVHEVHVFIDTLSKLVLSHDDQDTALKKEILTQFFSQISYMRDLLKTDLTLFTEMVAPERLDAPENHKFQKNLTENQNKKRLVIQEKSISSLERALMKDRHEETNHIGQIQPHYVNLIEQIQFDHSGMDLNQDPATIRTALIHAMNLIYATYDRGISLDPGHWPRKFTQFNGKKVYDLSHDEKRRFMQDAREYLLKYRETQSEYVGELIPLYTTLIAILGVTLFQSASTEFQFYPNANQLISCLLQTFYPRAYFQIGTGEGKTAISALTMLLQYCMGFTPIYISTTKDLTDQSYYAISPLLSELNFSVALYNGEVPAEGIETSDFLIVSLDFILENLAKHRDMKHWVKSYSLIVDEADVPLFRLLISYKNAIDHFELNPKTISQEELERFYELAIEFEKTQSRKGPASLFAIDPSTMSDATVLEEHLNKIRVQFRNFCKRSIKKLIRECEDFEPKKENEAKEHQKFLDTILGFSKSVYSDVIAALFKVKKMLKGRNEDLEQHLLPGEGQEYLVTERVISGNVLWAVPLINGVGYPGLQYSYQAHSILHKMLNMIIIEREDEFRTYRNLTPDFIIQYPTAIQEATTFAHYFQPFFEESGRLAMVTGTMGDNEELGQLKSWADNLMIIDMPRFNGFQHHKKSYAAELSQKAPTKSQARFISDYIRKNVLHTEEITKYKPLLVLTSNDEALAENHFQQLCSQYPQKLIQFYTAKGLKVRKPGHEVELIKANAFQQFKNQSTTLGAISITTAGLGSRGVDYKLEHRHYALQETFSRFQSHVQKNRTQEAFYYDGYSLVHFDRNQCTIHHGEAATQFLTQTQPEQLNLMKRYQPEFLIKSSSRHYAALTEFSYELTRSQHELYHLAVLLTPDFPQDCMSSFFQAIGRTSRKGQFGESHFPHVMSPTGQVHFLERSFIPRFFENPFIETMQAAIRKLRELQESDLMNLLKHLDKSFWNSILFPYELKESTKKKIIAKLYAKGRSETYFLKDSPALVIDKLIEIFRESFATKGVNVESLPKKMPQLLPASTEALIDVAKQEPLPLSTEKISLQPDSPAGLLWVILAPSEVSVDHIYASYTVQCLQQKITPLSRIAFETQVCVISNDWAHSLRTLYKNELLSKDTHYCMISSGPEKNKIQNQFLSVLNDARLKISSIHPILHLGETNSLQKIAKNAQEGQSNWLNFQYLSWGWKRVSGLLQSIDMNSLLRLVKKSHDTDIHCAKILLGDELKKTLHAHGGVSQNDTPLNIHSVTTGHSIDIQKIQNIEDLNHASILLKQPSDELIVNLHSWNPLIVFQSMWNIIGEIMTVKESHLKKIGFAPVFLNLAMSKTLFLSFQKTFTGLWMFFRPSSLFNQITAPIQSMSKLLMSPFLHGHQTLFNQVSIANFKAFIPKITDIESMNAVPNTLPLGVFLENPLLLDYFQDRTASEQKNLNERLKQSKEILMCIHESALPQGLEQLVQRIHDAPYDHIAINAKAYTVSLEEWFLYHTLEKISLGSCDVPSALEQEKWGLIMYLLDHQVQQYHGTQESVTSSLRNEYLKNLYQRVFTQKALRLEKRVASSKIFDELYEDFNHLFRQKPGEFLKKWMNRFLSDWISEYDPDASDTIDKDTLLKACDQLQSKIDRDQRDLSDKIFLHDILEKYPHRFQQAAAWSRQFKEMHMKPDAKFFEWIQEDARNPLSPFYDDAAFLALPFEYFSIVQQRFAHATNKIKEQQNTQETFSRLTHQVPKEVEAALEHSDYHDLKQVDLVDGITSLRMDLFYKSISRGYLKNSDIMISPTQIAYQYWSRVSEHMYAEFASVWALFQNMPQINRIRSVSILSISLDQYSTLLRLIFDLSVASFVTLSLWKLSALGLLMYSVIGIGVLFTTSVLAAQIQGYSFNDVFAEKVLAAWYSTYDRYLAARYDFPAQVAKTVAHVLTCTYEINPLFVLLMIHFSAWNQMKITVQDRAELIQEYCNHAMQLLYARIKNDNRAFGWALDIMNDVGLREVFCQALSFIETLTEILVIKPSLLISSNIICLPQTLVYLLYRLAVWTESPEILNKFDAWMQWLFPEQEASFFEFDGMQKLSLISQYTQMQNRAQIESSLSTSDPIINLTNRAIGQLDLRDIVSNEDVPPEAIERFVQRASQ